MADDPDQQDAPKETEDEDRAKSYSIVFAYLGGRCSWSKNIKIPGEYNYTCQKAEIASIGFGAATNDDKANSDLFIRCNS